MNRDLPPGMRRRGQAIQALSIGRETAKRLRVFARKNRITLYMLFLAALTLVLQRLTNKTAAVVWGNFQNRNPQISDLMGWCANTLPLAIDVGNDRVLSNVLDQVRLAVLRGLEHQHVPLASLWPALGGPKLFDDLTILFDVIGDDREEEATPAFAGHLGFRSVEIPGVFLRSHVSLALCVTISGVDLRMEVTYATETFSTQTVRWILRNMIGILQRMTEDASAPLSSIVRPRVRKKNARADCELPQQQTTYGSWQLLHQTDWGS